MEKNGSGRSFLCHPERRRRISAVENHTVIKFRLGYTGRMISRPSSWPIVFFESTRGERYVEAFIESLDSATLAKVLRTIDLLEVYGPRLGMPHSKKVVNSIAELRIRGKVDVRILYTYYRDTIVLLHAFQKKSQRMPKQELELAIARSKTLRR